MGFFNQQAAEQLRLEETAAEYLQRNFNLPHQDARKCLGRFGLEGHAHTLQIAKLSGEGAGPAPEGAGPAVGARRRGGVRAVGASMGRTGLNGAAGMEGAWPGWWAWPAPGGGVWVVGVASGGRGGAGSGAGCQCINGHTGLNGEGLLG